MGLNGWQKKSAQAAVRELGTSLSGLSEEEATRRLRGGGPNELTEEGGQTPLGIFIGQFNGFLVRILIGATIFSALIGQILDAVAIILIVFISAALGFFQEYKAEKTIAALKRMTAHEAVVIRNGKERKIPSTMLVPGDMVLIDQGTRVPADMRIMEEVELKVDESCLTGESTPVNKTTEPVTRDGLAEAASMLWSGTVVIYGRAKGVVTETGMSTQIGRIAGIVQEAGEEPTPLQRRLDTFSKKLGFLILGVCAVVIAMGLLRSGPLSGLPITDELLATMVMTGIALAVAAIPEGLPIIVTVTLALGVQRLSSSNALMRRLPAVETLGSTTVICSDKTGTLTKNEMTITRLWHSGKSIDVEGGGYSPKGRFMFRGREVHPGTDSTLLAVLRSGALCSNASVSRDSGTWCVFGDPTEGSLVVAAAKAGLGSEKLSSHKRIKEFPFSSERKMMSVITTRGEKSAVHAKGAPETILSRCTHIMRNGRRSRLTGADRDHILGANQGMGDDALRVLAVATRSIRGRGASRREAESGLTFLGMVGMIDPPRDSVRNDISLCRKAGIKVVMITGDHRNTALAIARELGISQGDSRSLTGEELDGLSDSQLRSAVGQVSVYARVNPEHKVRIVEALSQKGHIIAMTGDGVNDAPALKKADIGVSMGIKGTDVAKEASDMILRDDNFSTIVQAVSGGRAIYDNIKKFIQYLLSSNVGEVLVVFLAILIGFTDPATGLVIIPLTAIQLLWINLLTDGLPALALGVDPPSPNIMDRPPRSPRESILSRSVLTDIFIVGAVIAVGTLFLFWMSLPSGAAKAVTMAFTAMVVFEMVRIQSVRMKYNVGLFSNMKLVLAMAASVAMQVFVIYSPVLHPLFAPLAEVFTTVPLGLEDWAWIIGVSSTVMITMFIKERLFGAEL